MKTQYKVTPVVYIVLKSMLCYYGDEKEEYRRWEDNIKMNLKEIGVNVRSWIDSAQDMDYWRAPYVCCIEPPGYISHRVS